MYVIQVFFHVSYKGVQFVVRLSRVGKEPVPPTVGPDAGRGPFCCGLFLAGPVSTLSRTFFQVFLFSRLSAGAGEVVTWCPGVPLATRAWGFLRTLGCLFLFFQLIRCVPSGPSLKSPLPFPPHCASCSDLGSFRDGGISPVPLAVMVCWCFFCCYPPSPGRPLPVYAGPPFLFPLERFYFPDRSLPFLC